MRKIFATAALGLCLTACGNESKDKQQAEAAPEAKAEISPAEAQNLEANFADIPEVAIVRVALDVNGNVDPDAAPELRTAASADASNIEGTFASANAPEAMVTSADELDADSSTQSWRRWRAGRRFNNYWYNSFRPAVRYRGYSYNYSYNNYYTIGGYGYYCYNRNRYW